MSIENQSTFLDIGSGFGKPVFHSAMQTGCESYGVEIVPARVSFCVDQKYTFEDYYREKNKSRQATKRGRHSQPVIQVSVQGLQSSKRSAVSKTQKMTPANQIKQSTPENDLDESKMTETIQKGLSIFNQGTVSHASEIPKLGMELFKLNSDLPRSTI